MHNLTVYRSSAGSGKTFTLVKQYLTMILRSENPSGFRQILAITFTNKAAYELKERILDQLIVISGLEHGDDTMAQLILEDLKIDTETLQSRAKNALKSIVYNYGDLGVSTIDRFVLRIVRYFNKELGAAPDFSLVVDMKEINQRAMERVMSKVGIDPKITDLAKKVIQFRSELGQGNDLKKELDSMSYFLKKESSAPAVKLLESLTVQDIEQAYESLSSQNVALRKNIENQISVINKIVLNHPLVEEGFAKFFVGFVKKLSRFDSGTLDLLRKKYWHGEGMIKKPFQAQFESDHQMLTSKLEPLHGDIAKWTVMQMFLKNATSMLLAKYLTQAIDEIREEENIELIADNNERIRAVVEDNPAPFIYERIGERYKHFFIDEFQDTSILQWQNMIPLIEESLGRGFQNILVGDSKQSIYGFRGGEMEQMVMLPKIYNGRPSHQDAERLFTAEYREEVLEYNFRSSKEVVEFNNSLIEHLLQSKDQKLRDIYGQHTQKPSKGAGGRVEVSFFEKGVGEEVSLGVELVKQTVDRLVVDGQYGTIAILVRTKKNGSDIADYLQSHDIPIQSAESLHLDKNRKVKFLIALLYWTVGRHNEEHLLIVLNYIYQQKEIAQTRAQFLKKYNKIEALDTVLADCGYHINQETILQKGLYQGLEYLVDYFQMDDTDRYIMSLLNLVAQSMVSDGGNIDQFLDKWTQKTYTVDSPDDINAVRILTVHASKGLEFDKVILPLYTPRSQLHNTDVWLSTTGDSVSYKMGQWKSELEFSEYSEEYLEAKRKYDIDEFNNLYVGLTRAKNVLSIVMEKPGTSAMKDGGTNPSIYQYVTTHLQENNEVWSIGDMPKTTSKTNVDDTVQLQPYEKMDWQNDLRIALRDELKTKELRWGNIIHDVLAKSSSEAESIQQIKKLLQSMSITNEQAENLSQIMKQVWSNPQLSDWNNSAKQVFNEKEIIDSEGDLFRPDRIYDLGSDLVVLDFKTGSFEEKNTTQVRKYVQLIIEIENRLCRGYLYFTQTNELIPVS